MGALIFAVGLDPAVSGACREALGNTNHEIVLTSKNLEESMGMIEDVVEKRCNAVIISDTRWTLEIARVLQQRIPEIRIITCSSVPKESSTYHLQNPDIFFSLRNALVGL